MVRDTKSNIPHDVPFGFRGFRWEPTDEQDVVILFGRLLEHLPRPLAIENARTGFPDCKAVDTETGEVVRIEFELNASHFFRDHRGRGEGCDWIVCWHNDLDSTPDDSPTIVALDTMVDAVAPGLVLNRLPPSLTPQAAFHRRVSGLDVREQGTIERLLQFGAGDGLRIVWPETNGASFTVRGPLHGKLDVEYFKVSCSGRLSVAFSRWVHVDQDFKADLASRLNGAIGVKCFNGSGKAGWELSEIFRTDRAVDLFIGEWKRLTA